MAASELNNRLDYLISYSSQLVFVCSDKIQQQSQVIDSFLTHQNEQADLALLTANELTPLVIYREKLFRQLVSQTQDADFNLPLNQLLAPLNNHSGSILINIFQAENLPNKLVKELWDLVLQSRFANNKQHLNVLLMGLSDWAESAKSGLGAKSKGQPIVLNSQTDTVQTSMVQTEHEHTETHEISDLESFIQDKRKKFAKRIEDRQEKSYISQPIYKKWWVASLFGLFFLAVFSGILGWQYPEKISVMMSYFDAQLSPQEQTISPSNATEPVETVETIETIETVEALEIGLVIQANDELTTQINTATVDEISTKALLVTDWKTASAKLEVQSSKVMLQTSNIDKQINPPKRIDSPSQPPTPDKKLATNTHTVNDYQVEDIIAEKGEVEVEPLVRQIEFQLGNISQATTDNLINLESAALLALPNENFVIQIAAMASVSILQDYIKDQQLGQQLWLYKTQRYGGDWYVLLKNQHFSSIENARDEIINLADAMLKNIPFVKSIGQVKQEISLSKT